MNSADVVIVGAARTPIGAFLGAFADTSSASLGAAAIRSAIERSGAEAGAIEEVVMGNVLQAGLGQNPARLAANNAGLRKETTAWTVNMVCGSGLKAVETAAQSIASGARDIVVAGGMENMSQAPFLLRNARSGLRLGHRELVDSMLYDGLWCSIADCHMGMTAENLCKTYGFTREQLDEYAYLSHRKAQAAAAEGRFEAEITPISVPRSKGMSALVDADESIRPDTTVDRLARLRPAFDPEGLVTAGNASSINDGAAAFVLMSARKAEALGLRPLALLRSFASAGVEPSLMGLGPIPAAQKALARAGLRAHDIDLVEANEAFASQALAFSRLSGFDPAVTNVNGGAIALGHPIGASGARVLVTLLYEMRRRSARLGLAALCIGGGQGIAAVIERVPTKEERE